ncbi:MAG: hypothetical protein WDM81_07800 [Rhizomicrobium sp.]
MGQFTGPPPPIELDLAALQQAGDQPSDLADIEFRAGRPGGAESNAHELEPGQCLQRARRDDLQRVGAHRRVALVLHHFEAVDDRTERADQVMADPADQESGEFDVVHGRAVSAGSEWFANGNHADRLLRNA